MEEEYCWAIAQAAVLSYFGRSGSSVLEIGFQLRCVVLFIHMRLTVCALTSDMRKIRFEPDHPERITALSRGSVLTLTYIGTLS